MNYFQHVSLAADQTIIAAWDSQVAEAIGTPEVEELLVQRGGELFARFAVCYAQLRALPRGARRALLRQLTRSQVLTGISPESQRNLARTLAGAALVLALGQGVAQSATITVNTNIPTILADGKCSLVEAIINANNDALTHPDCAAGSGADTIALPAASVHTILTDYDSTYGATRLPAITSQITIQGNGGKITRKKSKLLSRLIAVASSGDLTLDNVSVSGGAQYFGGAIVNFGMLTITDSTLSGNTAVRGGAIYNYTDGAVTISNSVITGNKAAYGGAGIFTYRGAVTVESSALTKNVAPYGGGVYSYNGTVSIENSTISSNTGYRGGGIRYHGGEFTIERSLVANNKAAASGGGISGEDNGTLTISNSVISGNSTPSFGAGISLASAYVTIENSTISGNKAGYAGGGIANFGAFLIIENSTISGNSAKRIGGGLWNQGPAALSQTTISSNSVKNIGGGIYNSFNQLTLNRSLVSGNKAGVGPEINNRSSNSATVVADNFNLFGVNGNSGVTGFAPGVSDIVPPAGVLISNILAPLANNGGPTQTHALVAGSPAIDASPADADCPSTDQRGTLRPQGPLCDIGAFEK
ncbi:MAG TPA: right-handed parallel beta-helix repeat-containing protein [Candidatus Binatia bacterium]